MKRKRSNLVQLLAPRKVVSPPKTKTDNQRTFKCTKCDFKSPLENALRCHVTAHSGVYQTCIYNCGFTSDIKSRFTVRCESYHNCKEGQAVRKAVLYSCNSCGYKCRSSGGIMSHRRAHSGVFRKCEYCDFKSDIKAHFKRSVGNSNLHNCKGAAAAAKLGNLFQCTHAKCTFSTIHLSAMSGHLKSHSGIFETCKYCGFTSDITGHWKQQIAPNRHRCKASNKARAAANIDENAFSITVSSSSSSTSSLSRSSSSSSTSSSVNKKSKLKIKMEKVRAKNTVRAVARKARKKASKPKNAAVHKPYVSSRVSRVRQKTTKPKNAAVHKPYVSSRVSRVRQKTTVFIAGVASSVPQKGNYSYQPSVKIQTRVTSSKNTINTGNKVHEIKKRRKQTGSIKSKTNASSSKNTINNTGNKVRQIKKSVAIIKKDSVAIKKKKSVTMIEGFAIEELEVKPFASSSSSSTTSKSQSSSKTIYTHGEWLNEYPSVAFEGKHKVHFKVNNEELKQQWATLNCQVASKSTNPINNNYRYRFESHDRVDGKIFGNAKNFKEEMKRQEKKDRAKAKKAAKKAKKAKKAKLCTCTTGSKCLCVVKGAPKKIPLSDLSSSSSSSLSTTSSKSSLQFQKLSPSDQILQTFLNANDTETETKQKLFDMMR